MGETASTALPAVQANPPAEVETEEEESWWSIASPWVHGGLDALGFVPGLGAIPDIINAGIYAVEGDAVNAGLSGVGAIPIFGDAVKGGVLVGKRECQIFCVRAGNGLPLGRPGFYQVGLINRSPYRIAN